MGVWVVEIIPLDAGYFLDDGNRVTVLHHKNVKAEVNDVKFARLMLWYGGKDIPLVESESSGYPLNWRGIGQISVPAMEGCSGKFTGDVKKPYRGSCTNVRNDWV
ncbi:hypothetical protein N7462_007776 [Penicillium macrosclerotiorum]|uniref:uncharacterized protein n=1 Tax=Penicillium macrosclerotiorum TaxID=303699 RepID=UPI00254711C8|nr:uncharacterized protein N7462_007776 [Penicillium macrosclerotiorum]KAJ5679532.1 hypothetical protein N7462_007776 [Penicillium macrosclerotiorum]